MVPDGPTKPKKPGLLSLVAQATAEAKKAADKREKELRAAFNVFDTDGSGSLSVEELKAVLMRPSGAAPMTSAQVQQIIDEFDANGDGELQFEEFASWWAPKTVSSEN